jgi:hypothetical protein
VNTKTSSFTEIKLTASRFVCKLVLPARRRRNPQPGRLRHLLGQADGCFFACFFSCAAGDSVVRLAPVTTLVEIETAADALSATEKQQLLLFLTARLQAQGALLPDAPALPRERASDWMAEDEAAMRRFRPSA